MSDPCYIGIDTSNYTTSLAIASAEGEILANLKAPLPVKAGERGLRQSDALFAHVKNLPELMQRAEALLRGKSPVAVGVSARPRDAEDSYMPCFLAGVAAAESIAACLHVPLHRFSHQNGHLMAALYSAGALSLIGAPFAAFHVSGGTTELLRVHPRGLDFSVELIGGTADLNAGQVVDRIGVAMGLSFPCGPALEQLAVQNEKKVPKPRICVRDGVCNLSGLENMALKLLAETGDKPLVAAFVLEFIAQTLAAMAAFARREDGGLPLLFAGGVMSNRLIAKRLCETLGGCYFAEPPFSADNAAGVALLCRAAALNS
jgi:N6-L-threonylcarbamoyladenine synthase